MLAIAFVAYQLWGTALYEQQAQSHLKAELAQQLHHTLPTSTAHLDAKSPLAGLPPLAHQTAPAVPDPAVNQPIGLLSIPKIGLLDAIVEGVGEAQLEQGPGHYQGTPLPGQAGNVSIAGHRTTYAHPFYNLNELAPGDGIYILTKQGFFRYKVTQSQVVAPTDVAVLDSKANQSTLTLTTCNPRYSAATRLVVTAAFAPGPGKATGNPSSTTTTLPEAEAHVSAIPGDSLTGTAQPHLARGAVVGPDGGPGRRRVARVAPFTSEIPLARRPGGRAGRAVVPTHIFRAHQPRATRQLLTVASGRTTGVLDARPALRQSHARCTGVSFAGTPHR